MLNLKYATFLEVAFCAFPFSFIIGVCLMLCHKNNWYNLQGANGSLSEKKPVVVFVLGKPALFFTFPDYIF